MSTPSRLVATPSGTPARDCSAAYELAIGTPSATEDDDDSSFSSHAHPSLAQYVAAPTSGVPAEETPTSGAAAAAIISPAHIDHDEQMRDAVPMQRRGASVRQSPEASAHEPEWHWSPSAIKKYLRYWLHSAKLYVMDRASPTRIRNDWTRNDSHVLLQSVYCVLGFLLFFLLFYFNGFAATVPGYGPPSELTCFDTGWDGECGLNGADCQPFESNVWQPLRCPHRCTLLPSDGFLTGGENSIYKADSRLCDAAMHAGVISSSTGGCFLYRPAGAQNFFDSTAGHNGLTSAEFPSWFPGAMQVRSVDSQYCSQFGVAIVLVAAAFFLPLVLMQPDGRVLWFSMLYFGYWYIALSLSDRDTQFNLFFAGTLNSVILAVFGYVMYHVGPKHALYVPPEYEARSKTELPWRWCFGRRQIHARDTRSINRANERSSASYDPSVVQSVRSSVDIRLPPRLSASSSHQVVDASRLVEPPRSVSVRDVVPVVSQPDLEEAVHSAGVSSPLGPQRRAIQAQRLTLNLPLIADGAQPSPSPSPTPSPGPSESPPATSADYHPPMRLSDPIVEGSLPPQELSAEVPTLPRTAGTPAKVHADCSTSSLVLRPWYELYFLYALPFLLALHFNYLIYIPGFSDIDITSGLFSHGVTGVFIVLAFMVVIGFVIVSHMKLAFQLHLLFRYLLYYSYVGVAILVISLLWPTSASFHLHHVLAGMLLLPVTRFPTRVSLLFQAIVTGIFLNGLAIWNLTSDWDINATFYPALNPFNVRPIALQLGNSTVTTARVIWPVYTNRSDAIGATLFLNGIQIWHSTYEATTYGGGRTLNLTETTTGRAVAVRKQTTMHDRRESIEEAASMVDLRTNQMSDAHFDLPSALPTTAIQVGRHPMHQRSPEHVPIRTASDGDLPVYLRRPHLRFPHSRIDRARMRTRSTGSASTLAQTDAFRRVSDRLLQTTLWREPTAMDDRKELARTRAYYIFRLVNLLPNTTYVLNPGYILPNQVYNLGDPITITTKAKKP